MNESAFSVEAVFVGAFVLIVVALVIRDLLDARKQTQGARALLKMASEEVEGMRRRGATDVNELEVLREVLLQDVAMRERGSRPPS